jgi:hypothetical protein
MRLSSLRFPAVLVALALPRTASAQYVIGARDEKALRAVVEDVLRNLGRLPGGSAPAPSAPAAAPAVRRSGPRFGVFDEMKDACAAAQDAFEQLKQNRHGATT